MWHSKTEFDATWRGKEIFIQSQIPTISAKKLCLLASCRVATRYSSLYLTWQACISFVLTWTADTSGGCDSLSCTLWFIFACCSAVFPYLGLHLAYSACVKFVWMHIQAWIMKPDSLFCAVWQISACCIAVAIPPQWNRRGNKLAEKEYVTMRRPKHEIAITDKYGEEPKQFYRYRDKKFTHRSNSLTERWE